MAIKNIRRNDLLCSFFNKDLFYEVKANKDIVKRYFQVNEKDNPLAESLLNLVFTADYSEIRPDKIKYVLSSVPNLLEDEVNAVFNKIKKYVKLTDTDILNDYSEFLKQVCSSQATIDAQKEAGDDTAKFIDILSKFEYKSIYSDEMKLVNFKDLNPDDELDKSFHKLCDTEYEFVKRAYPSVEGWLDNQLIMVVGEPGGGKSLFMMSVALELCKQGKRCVYIALGDLSNASFIIRMGAMHCHVPLDEAARRSQYCTAELLKAIDDRLIISCVAANKLSVEKCLKKLKAVRDQFDAVFFDYDSNFKPKGDFGLYIEGGGLYADLSEVTLNWQKFSMVGSQPKQQFWGKSFIPKSGAGESSRKQHFVDGMITIGKVDNNGLPCGRISWVKNRNGKDNISVHYIRTDDGCFVQVPMGLYNALKHKAVDSISINELRRLIAKEEAFAANDAIDKVTGTDSSVDPTLWENDDVNGE